MVLLCVDHSRFAAIKFLGALGAPMTLGSLTDLAKLDDMPSYPSLARFITAHADFPVLQRGQYGKPFILDLDAASAFVREHWRDGRNVRRLRRLAVIGAASPAEQVTLPGLFDTL